VPLTARDVVLVLRAKDEASRVINQVGRTFGNLGADAQRSAQHMMAAGGGLAALGATMTGTGIALGNTLWGFTQAAVDYRQQAALAVTQAEGFGATIEQLEAIGMRVAKVIPVPLQETQEGLYEIFSAMDVNVAQAEVILTGLARAAVAGQTDIATAGEGTIAVLNAWGLTSRDLERIMDVQFQMVRRGVGTYAEFSNAIGLAIPSAVRAGQEFETVAGMMAFLTRNGLSASSAASSAGRALELLANAKTIERLEKMGVAVKDARGEFLPLVYIVQQMKDQFGDLTAPERAAALNDLFKGAGNSVQARRFWDLAISQTDAFLTNVDAMDEAAGSLDQAYDIMFNQPQSQMQLLRNNWDILKVTFGQALLPILVKGTEWGLKFVGWIQNLNPETKEMIAKGLALASAFLVIGGAITGLAGGILMFVGFIKYMGGIVSVIKILAAFNVWILAIAAAAYLIYKNWDTIGPMFQNLWQKMIGYVQEFKAWFDANWPAIWAKTKEIAAAVWEWIANTWAELWPKIRAAAEATWTWLSNTWEELWPKIKSAAAATWEWIKAAWPEVVKAFDKGVDTIEAVWEYLKENVPIAWAKLKKFGSYLIDKFGPGAEKIWDAIKEHALPILEGLVDIFKRVTEGVRNGSGQIQQHWNTLWSYIQPVLRSFIALVKLLWDAFATTFAAIVGIIRGSIDIIAGILTGDWGRIWDGAKQIFQSFWDWITGMFGALVEFFFEIMSNILKLVGTALGDLWKLFKEGVKKALGAGGDLIQGLWDGAVGVFEDFLDWVMKIPDLIMNGIKSLFGIASPSTKMASIGRDVIQGFWNGAKEVFASTLAWFISLPGKILTGIGNLGQTLWEKGRSILDGFRNGVVWFWDTVLVGWFGGLAAKVLGAVPALGQTLWEKGRAILAGFRDGVVWFWENILLGWLGGMAWRALNAVPSMIGVLVQAGKDLIQGFWNGAISKWNEMKGWLDSIIPDMPDWGKIGEQIKGGVTPGGGGKGKTASMDARYLSAPTTGSTTLHPGAVVIHVGSVRDSQDIDRIRSVVEEVVTDIMRQSIVPTYGGY
jgi:TP901 family phage tail tape measure protein